MADEDTKVQAACESALKAHAAKFQDLSTQLGELRYKLEAEVQALAKKPEPAPTPRKLYIALRYLMAGRQAEDCLGVFTEDGAATAEKLLESFGERGKVFFVEETIDDLKTFEGRLPTARFQTGVHERLAAHKAGKKVGPATRSTAEDRDLRLKACPAMEGLEQVFGSWEAVEAATQRLKTKFNVQPRFTEKFVFLFKSVPGKDAVACWMQMGFQQWFCLDLILQDAPSVPDRYKAQLEMDGSLSAAVNSFFLKEDQWKERACWCIYPTALIGEAGAPRKDCSDCNGKGLIEVIIRPSARGKTELAHAKGTRCICTRSPLKDHVMGDDDRIEPSPSCPRCRGTGIEPPKTVRPIPEPKPATNEAVNFHVQGKNATWDPTAPPVAPQAAPKATPVPEMQEDIIQTGLNGEHIITIIPKPTVIRLRRDAPTTGVLLEFDIPDGSPKILVRTSLVAAERLQAVLGTLVKQIQSDAHNPKV
jgi:hypothetical protein